MTLSNKLYDRLKFLAMVGLPALAALYLGLGQLWNWPETEKVVASIVLVNTFLGALLRLSTAKYKRNLSNYDGFLSATGVDEITGHPNLNLVVTTPPAELLASDVVRLKVGPPPA